MNCANHPDRERTAFCQTCGKPLCTECTRTVGSSVFCEPCLAARIAGTTPPAPGFGYTGVPPFPSPGAPAEPNPTLAAILGFIPGVGAMYNGQYAKGLVHLMVFALLVSLAHENGIFGLFIMGWQIYMVIEAHHTARARRDGTPLPNPFGLNDLSERLGFGRSWPTPPAAPFGGTPASAPDPSAPFSAPPYAGFTSATQYGGTPVAPGFVASGPDTNPNPNAQFPPYTPFAPPSAPFAPPYTYVPPVSQWGAPQDYATPAGPGVAASPLNPAEPYPDTNLPSRRSVPTGAIWLIGLGIFFLAANSGIFAIRIRYFGPVLLIGIGVWIFVHRMTSTGHGLESDGSPTYRWRLAHAIRSSIWLVLTGFIWLLDVFDILHWGSSWPLFLIAGGLMMFLQRTVFSGYQPGPYGVPPYPGSSPYPGAAQPPAPVTTTAVVPAPGTDFDSSARVSDAQEGR